MSCPEIGLHIKCKEMTKKQAIIILKEREDKGTSYRTLGLKYGVSHVSIHRLIMSNRKKEESEKEVLSESSAETLPDDIAFLKEELRRAKIKLELQDLMIDIASKELGVDIRKKSGTRRS